MLVFDMRRALNRSRRVNVTDNRIRLIMIVTKLEQRRRHRLIDNLYHAAAHQLLVLHQRQIRLHPGSVTVHKKSDGAGGGENCDLGVAVAEFFPVGESFVPAGFGGFVETARDIVFVDVVDRGAMRSDEVEERLAVDVPAGAGGAGSCGASLRMDGAEPRPHTSTTKI